MNESGHMPQVTVIMPAYNAEKFIEETIASVQAQTFSDWELIVLDDGSKDETVKCVEKLASEDPRITILQNEKNMGVAKTRNRGIEMARGEYIALLDSDDVWYPEKLEQQLALAKRSGAEIIYCSYAMVDEEGDQKHAPFIVPPQTDFKKMLVSSVISCSTVLMQAETAKKYRFDETYYHEDYVLWMQLMQDGKRAVGCTQVLAAYRLRSSSRSSDKLSSAKKRWVIYRECLKLPFFTSVYYLVRYAVRALRKYS